MSKIIRRTIIVTITETWTIAWPDYVWPDVVMSGAPRGAVLTNTQVSRKISVVTAPTDRTLQLVDTVNQSQFGHQLDTKHTGSNIDYETN